MAGTADEPRDTPTPDFGDSLYRVSRLYRRRADGSLQYDGERPGPGWHAHGFFPCSSLMLVVGQPQRMPVWKRRWLHVETRTTCHSRPPDDVPRLRSSSLVVAVMLWAWLSSGLSLVHCKGVLAEPEALPCERTLQRWGKRSVAAAVEIQQAIREVLIERSEPRPLERLFPGGLSPPPGLLRKRWLDPPLVGSLWRALAFAVLGAAKLEIAVAILLAEARGRWEGPTDSPIP